LVEHATENRSVGGSIPPLGIPSFPADWRQSPLNQRVNVIGLGAGHCLDHARTRRLAREGLESLAAGAGGLDAAHATGKDKHRT